MSFARKFSFFLMPPIFQGLLSFVMLPVVTKILNPRDFGVFALLTAFTSLGTTIASMGSGYLLAAYYPVVDFHKRRSLISSILAIGIIILFLFIGIFIILWPMVIDRWEVFAAMPSGGVILAFTAMLLAFPWYIATDVVTLEGRARLYGTIVIGQSIASAVAVTICLYLFKLELLSLFVAATAGSLITLFGGSVVLKPYLGFSVSKQWIREILKLGPIVSLGNILDNLQIFLERYVLSLFVGLNQLGLYSHSQQYKTLIAMGVKAAARSIWPVTLSEARKENGDFYYTKKVWTVVNVGVIAVGLLFATLGKEIIALLTHDKFTQAYSLVALWTVYILVQNTGKPQAGILFAFNQGKVWSKMLIGAISISILIIIPLVKVFGLIGALVAMLCQQILFRIGIQLYVRKKWITPFQDEWAIIGTFFILTALALSRYFQFKFLGNLYLFFVLLTILMLLRRQIIKDVLFRIPVFNRFRTKDEIYVSR